MGLVIGTRRVYVALNYADQVAVIRDWGNGDRFLL